MRLTIAEARALGIAEEYLRDLKPIFDVPLFDVERSRAVREDLAVSTRPKQSKSSDGMNKLERSFADDVLNVANRGGRICGWWREPFSIRLAGKTFYKPDFGVWPIAGGFTLIDTKGHMEDDAAVKIKVAAERYPCFRWLLVYRRGRNGWDVREVTRAGISRESIAVAWIEGNAS